MIFSVMKPFLVVSVSAHIHYVVIVTGLALFAHLYRLLTSLPNCGSGTDRQRQRTQSNSLVKISYFRIV